MSIVSKVTDFTLFNDRQKALFSLFDALGIAHETLQHPPVFTVAEGDALGVHGLLPGQGGKSLLLTNGLEELWLVIAADQTRVNLKRVAQTLETKRFSFAKPEIMQQVMQVTPGSATPFALVHDTKRQIRVVIDTVFTHTPQCVFHPLENRFSTVIAFQDLLRFIEHLGYQPCIMDLA